jgi:hypothetical protein
MSGGTQNPPGHKKQKQKNEKLKWPVNKHRAVNSKTFDNKPICDL